MNTFLLSFRAELQKSKRTAALWIVLLGSAFLPGLFFLMYLGRADVFTKRLGADPWLKHFGSIFEGGSFFLVPMFIILVASLVVQIEYRNNTWKQVMASPLKVGDVYFAKYLMVQLMIMATFVLITVWAILFGVLTGLLNSKYGFLHSPLPWKFIFTMSFKSYIAALGLSTIQYCLSLRFKNFIAAIGVGLALLITGLTIMTWDKVVYFPYAYSALSFVRSGSGANLALLKHEYWSLGYAFVFIILGYIDFSYKAARG